MTINWISTCQKIGFPHDKIHLKDIHEGKDPFELFGFNEKLTE